MNMDDLTGGAGERKRRLAALASDGTMEPEWLRRQLELALDDWEADQKTLVVDAEAREDY